MVDVWWGQTMFVEVGYGVGWMRLVEVALGQVTLDKFGRGWSRFSKV